MDQVDTSQGTVLIAGASGFLGRALTDLLIANGYGVIALSRHAEGLDSTTVKWNPREGSIDFERIHRSAPSGFDAIINLAGENLASKRWNDERMKALRDSRIGSTRLLAKHINGGKMVTRLFISASATGYYGDRGDEVLTEESEAGTGFLAELCRDWERAAELNTRPDVSAVKLRTGIVLDAKEGALAHMLPVFKMGIGGKLGTGMHFYPWITLNDYLRAVLFCIERSKSENPVVGAVNVVAPNPVRNTEFTSSLAKTIKRPAMIPAPHFALNIALGKIANEALLTSQRAIPKKLLDSGFEFRHATIDIAMAHVLGTEK